MRAEVDLARGLASAALLPIGAVGLLMATPASVAAGVVTIGVGVLARPRSVD